MYSETFESLVDVFFSGTNQNGAAWCQLPKAVARDMQLRILMRPPPTARNTLVEPLILLESTTNLPSYLAIK